MRRFFNTSYSSGTLNVWLLLLRLAVGLIMITHGWPKFQQLTAGKFEFLDPIGIGQTASFILVVFAEFICSLFLIIGFATRFSALVLVINMAVIVFIVHSNDPMGKKESAILYLLVYLTLLVLSAGKYSVDAMIGRKGRR